MYCWRIRVTSGPDAGDEYIADDADGAPDIIFDEEDVISQTQLSAVGIKAANNLSFRINGKVRARMWNGNFYVYDGLRCSKSITGASLYISGTKNRTVQTKDYGERLLSAYETTSPMFGDVGEGEIGQDGKTYIQIDPVFSETINLSQYQVFLQCYGAGNAYVAERKETYFVVQGTPGLSFGWEIKGKQIDYSMDRLEARKIELDDIDYASQAAESMVITDYGADAATHIEKINGGRTA